jgi:hypothetical protein
VISGGGVCGRHTAEDRHFLDGLHAAVLAEFADQEQQYLCRDCGARSWAPALADAPECCGWQLVPLPLFRDLLERADDPPSGDGVAEGSVSA